MQAPVKLFHKASSLGFKCSTNQHEHRISPAHSAASWCLLYQAGRWVLFVNGIAQINLQYSEVNDFLELRAVAKYNPVAVSI